MAGRLLNKQTGKATLLALLVFSLIHTFTNFALADEPALAVAPTRLVLSSIDLDSAVVAVGLKQVVINGQTYAQWLVDDNLVGWHNLSAPLGQVGNTVLNGHSDIHGRVFRDLKNVKVGDEIIAFSGQQEYRYRVTQKILVQEKGVSIEQRVENAKLIMPTEDERLTLITCARPGATHRLVVVAQPAR